MRSVYSMANNSECNLLFFSVWRLSPVCKQSYQSVHIVVFFSVRYGAGNGTALRFWIVFIVPRFNNTEWWRLIFERRWFPSLDTRNQLSLYCLFQPKLSIRRHVRRSNWDGHVQVMKGCTETRVVSVFILDSGLSRGLVGSRDAGTIWRKDKHLSQLGTEPWIYHPIAWSVWPLHCSYTVGCCRQSVLWKACWKRKISVII